MKERFRDCPSCPAFKSGFRWEEKRVLSSITRGKRCCHLVYAFLSSCNQELDSTIEGALRAEWLWKLESTLSGDTEKEETLRKKRH